jgi:hypothetical protein
MTLTRLYTIRKAIFLSILGILISVCLAPRVASAAIGCTLTNPAQDLKFVFPDMTSYREDVVTFSSLTNGESQFKDLESRLGRKTDPVFDRIDTPYTVYTIFRGEEKVGIIHGVNIPGKGGVIQLFLSIDPSTRGIRQMFFQRLESTASKLFRDKSFRAQFEGISLADWYMHDYYREKDPSNPRHKIARIQPPEDLSEESTIDYGAIMQGIRKNLVILDLLLFQRASDQYFLRAQERLNEPTGVHLKEGS